MSQELRAKLKAARKKLELTQNEAAQAWGVPVNTLICWENDQRTPAAFSLKMLNSMLNEILAEKGGKAAGKPEKKHASAPCGTPGPCSEQRTFGPAE
ncbi:MAG: family transcriptional regulator [Verrucomicrobiales bacterium]|nr:family transcriptional regulator [Verrucomicrobiales bacterium]